MSRIILATYSHRHGEDRAVFHDDEGAEAYRQSLAAQYWSDIMKGEMPADPAEASDAYFHRASEIGDEFFDTVSLEVEGIPADPVRDAAPALLASLRWAIGMAEEAILVREEGNDPEDTPEVIAMHREALEAARAAMAKAEGKL